GDAARGEAGGQAGVDVVAARLEHLHAGRRRQVVAGDDHVPRAPNDGAVRGTAPALADCHRARHPAAGRAPVVRAWERRRRLSNRLEGTNWSVWLINRTWSSGTFATS